MYCNKAVQSPRCNFKCSSLTTSCGSDFHGHGFKKYFGVQITPSCLFKCFFDHAKRASRAQIPQRHVWPWWRGCRRGGYHKTMQEPVGFNQRSSFIINTVEFVYLSILFWHSKITFYVVYFINFFSLSARTMFLPFLYVYQVHVMLGMGSW